MKKVVLFFALTSIVFVKLTLSNAEIKSPSDGDDTYGFPLTCLIQHSGMCDTCTPDTNLTEIFYWKLLVDILFAASLVAIGWIIFSGLKITRKSKGSYLSL